MFNNLKKKKGSESARDDLLTRLLASPKLGALLKGVGLFVKDYATDTAIANTLWRELGHEAADMADGAWLRFVHPEDHDRVADAERALVSGVIDVWEGLFRIQDGAGSYKRIRHKSVVLERGADQIPTLFVGWDVDVTEFAEQVEAASNERALQERRFLRSEAIRTAGAILSSELDPIRAAERVLSQADRVVPFDSASVWTLEGDQLVRLAARGSAASDTARREVVSDDTLRLLLDMRNPRLTISDQDPLPARLDVPLLVRGRVHGLLEFRSSDRNAYGYEETGAAVQFADHAVVALANALRYRATELEAATDWLTGLPTRRSFMTTASRLSERLSLEDPVSALMIDIDHFKQVNDAYGHQVGDTALAGVAEKCRASLRTQDLYCRYGGEEILALLPKTDGDTAFAVAERLRKTVECLRFSAAPDLALTVSVGVYSGTGRDDFRDLIARADEALYMAKSAGRNRCEVR
jgi:diguanylate cyclase (GGDEF)-like protein